MKSDRPFRIIIDAGLSTLGELTGIGTQCRGLFDGLRSHVDVKLLEYASLRRLPRPVRRSFYILAANAFAPSTSADIVHYFNYYVPVIRSAARKVVTIADLASYMVPFCNPPAYIRYARHVIRGAVQSSDMVVVPSIATKDDLVRIFPVAGPKTIVSFNGLRELPSRNPEEAMTERRILLHVGTLEKRKNLEFLVNCFKEGKAKGGIRKDVELILAGRPGFGYEEIRSAAGARSDIKFPGHVSDEVLAGLYQGALALVFPSLYEGFGVPLIEAMRWNIPIICSDIPSSVELNERHNHQMHLYSNERPQALVELLVHLASNHESVRAALNYGDLSLYDFSQVCRRHLEIYSNLLAKAADQ